MKVTIDVSKLKGNVVARVLRTDAGALAVKMDEILYNAIERKAEPGEFAHIELSEKFTVRVDRDEHQRHETLRALREVRDYLWRIAYEQELR